MVNLKRYTIPGEQKEQKEITTLICDMLEGGVLVPSHSLYSSPMWPVRKADGSWKRTVDYRGLNTVEPPTASAVPDMASTIQKVQQARRRLVNKTSQGTRACSNSEIHGLTRAGATQGILQVTENKLLSLPSP